MPQLVGAHSAHRRRRRKGHERKGASVVSDPHLEMTRRIIRGSSTADLRFDQHLRPVRYVIDAAGHLVLPAMVAMLTADETVLFVPEYGEDAAELLVTLEPFEDAGADGALADRWRIYHGEPEDVRWARCEIDAAKFEGHLVDGDAIDLSNPMQAVEARLCKTINTGDRAALIAFCRERGDIDVEEPLVVGIDPTGVDVRRRFDVVHIHLDEPLATEDDARRLLAPLLNA
jgi:hypothetical protein